MNLFKRNDSNNWQMTMTVGGKRHRESTPFPLSDKEGALRYMAQEYSKRVNQFALGVKPEITLEDAYDMSIAEVSGQTRRQYELCKRKILGIGDFAARWHLPKETLLSELSQQSIDSLRLHRAKEGLSNNSVNIEVRVLRRVYNNVRREYRANPDLEFRQLKKFAKTRYLSEAEIRLVLAELEKHQDSVVYEKALDLFLLLLDTGARLGEALALEWPDVRMSDGVVELYREKTGTLSLIPLTDRVRVRLELRAHQSRPFESMDCAVKRLRETISKICNVNDRIIRTRGKATIHSLRDTYATRMHQRGMSLPKIAKLLGHTQASMAAKYSHLETEDVLTEARALLTA